jgi:hypothetical protein
MSKSKYEEHVADWKESPDYVAQTFIDFIHMHSEGRVYECPIAEGSDTAVWLLVPPDVTDEEFLDQWKKDNKEWVDEQIEEGDEWEPSPA